MYLADLTNRSNIPVLEKLMAFSAARHEVLAHNIANIDVPGFKARRLDPQAFQAALRQAVGQRGDRRGEALNIPSSQQVRVDEQGHLQVTPSEEPVHNILFHDGTNVRIEVEMSKLAENRMAYDMASVLLKNGFEGLKKAIRGQV